MGPRTCDACERLSAWLVYAPGYPMPMIRACPDHLATALADDQRAMAAPVSYLLHPDRGQHPLRHG